jgi:uncharacterized membrane protein YdjX (TVP38/TMEM64 family)
MNLSYASATEPPARLPRVALLGAGLVAAAVFAGVTAGLVQPPDLEGALTDLSDTLGTWTYALVAALAFLETGAFVGLVAPGESAIVLGGVVAAEGEVSLAVILPLAWLAAALGDLASFWLGKRLGRRFLLAHGPRLGVTATRLERVEGFFAQHGPKAILAGRFIGIGAPSPPSWPAPRACGCEPSCPGACSAPPSGRRRSPSSDTPSTSPSARPPTR